MRSGTKCKNGLRRRTAATEEGILADYTDLAGKLSNQCRMQNAKCKMQKQPRLLNSAFCIHHSAFLTADRSKWETEINDRRPFPSVRSPGDRGAVRQLAERTAAPA